VAKYSIYLPREIKRMDDVVVGVLADLSRGLRRRRASTFE